MDLKSLLRIMGLPVVYCKLGRGGIGWNHWDGWVGGHCILTHSPFFRHSHVQTYPEGSKQQQITCYMHKDANNEWVVVRPWGYKRTSKDDTPLPEFVKDGDIVRLVHDQTGANLHSHDFYPAPLTKNAHEVTCYGNSTVGDQKDHWRIEIARETALDKPSTNKRIRSLTTRFRLRHVVSGCLLRSHSKTLPEWGFKQNEVACVPEADDGDIYNHWNVENHRHPDRKEEGGGDGWIGGGGVEL